MSSASAYVLGHADHEIERLQLQSSIIGPVTRRLIRESSIGNGMRVLDIRCGVGDVSLLLAETVGPTGEVVAFDREPRAVETARARAEAAGHRNIEFVVTSDEVLPKRPLDAAIGRYILVHQASPTAMVRRAVLAVRPGGIVAFHETPLHRPNQFLSFPHVDLFAQVSAALSAAFEATLPHHDVGGRLIACLKMPVLRGST